MPIHPLEPLSAAEVAEAVRLIRTIPSFNATTRIISIMLKEPARSGPCVDRIGNAGPSRGGGAVRQRFEHRL